MLYKTIAEPDRGINNDKRPYLIQPREWVTLDRFRAKNGVIRNFPGTLSILASGTGLIGYGTLIDQFTRFDGTTFLIIGDVSKLYQYNPSLKTLVDLSGVNVFSATRDDPWTSFFYKNTHYVVNKNDGMFSWAGVGAYTPVANAPRAKVAGVLFDHIIAFNYFDVVGGTGDHPQGISWNATGQVTVWVATSTNDAGAFDLDDTADLGVGMEPLAQDMILYKERNIIPLTWVGGTAVFARRPAINGVGLLGVYALANTGDEHFFMGPDTFYRYRGGVDIDDQFARRARDVVYNGLHPLFKNRARALFIEETREILFMYPDNSSAGDANMCVGYNIDEDDWWGPFPILNSAMMTGVIPLRVDAIADIVDSVATIVDSYPTTTGSNTPYRINPGGVSMAGFTNRAFTLVVDGVTDIVDSVATVVDNYPGLIGGALNLLATPGGFVWNVSEVTQSENGLDIARTAISGDHFLGNDATDEFGNPASIPVDSVFQIQALILEVGVVTSGSIQVYLGHKMAQHDPIVFDVFKVVNLASGSFSLRVPFRAIGRWFAIQIIAPNSVQFELGSYQFEFGLVGRR